MNLKNSLANYKKHGIINTKEISEEFLYYLIFQLNNLYYFFTFKFLFYYAKELDQNSFAYFIYQPLPIIIYRPR